MRAWHYLLVALTALVCPTTLLALGKEEKELLELVRSGHRAAVQSIRTFSCRFTTWDETPQGRFDMSGTHHRSLDLDAVREHTVERFGGFEQTTDNYFQKGRKLSVSKQRTPDGRIVSGQAIDRKAKDVAWYLAHMAFFGGSGELVTFNEMLNKKYELRQVKRVKEDGRELIYVDLVFDNKRFGLSFDPQVNYLIRKTVEGSAKGWEQDHGELEVVRFKEVAPAIYFPEEIRMRGYRKGQQIAAGVRTFADIRINQPLPPGTFEPHLPPGTEVSDFDQGKVFKVDAQGKFIELKGRRRPVNMPVSEAAVVSGTPRTATRTEPELMTRWLLPVSVLLLLLGAAGWVIRKYRQQMAADG
jgi:hypothetical protein